MGMVMSIFNYELLYRAIRILNNTDGACYSLAYQALIREYHEAMDEYFERLNDEIWAQ